MTSVTTTEAGVGVPQIRIGLRRVVSDTIVIAWRNLLRNVRMPQVLLFSTVQPVMFLVLFTFVFGGAMEQALPADLNYLDFLLPGLLIQNAMFGAGSTAMGLTEDLDKGVIDRFRSLPMARSAVLAGRTIADLLRNASVMVLVLTAAFLLGFRYQTSFPGFLAGVVVALLFAYALSWLMATIGLLVRNPEATQSAVMLPIFPLAFASSVFIIPQTMPEWLQPFVRNQPVSVIADTTRMLMIGPDAAPTAHDTAGQLLLAGAWIAALLLLFAPLAVRAYRRVDQ